MKLTHTLDSDLSPESDWDNNHFCDCQNWASSAESVDSKLADSIALISRIGQNSTESARVQLLKWAKSTFSAV